MAAPLAKAQDGGLPCGPHAACSLSRRGAQAKGDVGPQAVGLPEITSWHRGPPHGQAAQLSSSRPPRTGMGVCLFVCFLRQRCICDLIREEILREKQKFSSLSSSAGAAPSGLRDPIVSRGDGGSRQHRRVCPAPTQMHSHLLKGDTVGVASPCPLCPPLAGSLAWESWELAWSRSLTWKNFSQPWPPWWRTC